MKLLKVGAIISVVGLFAACSGQSTVSSDEQCQYQVNIPAPAWYCNPEVEGGLAATGSARTNPANDANLQRTMAQASARDALARQLEAKVSNMLSDWARTTGAGDAQTFDANFETVSRQLTQQTVSSTKQTKQWFAPDGTLVILMRMENPAAQVRDGISTSMGNQQALWQQFQSQQALEELDKQIDKTFAD